MFLFTAMMAHAYISVPDPRNLALFFLPPIFYYLITKVDGISFSTVLMSFVFSTTLTKHHSYPKSHDYNIFQNIVYIPIYL